VLVHDATPDDVVDEEDDDCDVVLDVVMRCVDVPQVELGDEYDLLVVQLLVVERDDAVVLAVDEDDDVMPREVHDDDLVRLLD
jgi:hypothetical protein